MRQSREPGANVHDFFAHALIDSLYQGTIRFNILLGAIGMDPGQEEIDQACKSANVRSVAAWLTLDIRFHSISP